MRLYVGAVIKNHEKSFHHFKKLIDELVTEFPELTICIYEDNSTDTTPTLLADLKSTYPEKVYYICDNYDQKNIMVRTCENKPFRITCIAHGRNILMELLEEKGLGQNSDDICIMIDPDVPVPFFTQNIAAHVKNFPENVDALFANGMSRHGKYYDTFAYRDSTYFFGVDVFGELNINRQNEKHYVMNRKIKNDEPLIPVMSAFGGLAMYRGTSIRGKRYSAYPTATLNKIYRNFMSLYPEHPEVKMVKSAQKNIETHLRGALLGIYLFEKKEDGGLFYYNCCGANYPIVCEHITFHAEMINDGKDKIFVCPSLIYISDHY
jgi:hypothetical protein